MSQENEIALSIVMKTLGEPKSSANRGEKVQWEFNCPAPPGSKCREDGDTDKFNLAYQSENKIFKCWKCKYSGFVYRLIGDYGTREDLKKLKLVIPEYKSRNKVNVFRKDEIDYDRITCKLPEGYIPLGKNVNSKYYRRAYNYLVNERKVSQRQIDEFQIGYTETGPRKFRIIIPSFNRLGKVNYYEARSYFSNPTMAYYKPDSPNKEDIIFNEKFINWDLPVYLVEGVFDMLRIPNSIPLLGKEPSSLLMSKMYDHKPKVVLCLDEDAIKDSLELYQSLSSMGIDVYFVDLNGLGDISYIYETEGQKGILKALKTKRRLDFEYFLKRYIQR